MSKKSKNIEDILPGSTIIKPPTAKEQPLPKNAKNTEKILSISLRPNKLDDIIGQDDIIKTIKSQFESERIPHFYLITGNIGSGKTTLARILAIMLQNEDKTKIDYTISPSKYDISEINASDKNGVEDMRELLERVKYKPIYPSIAKIVILDEAHMLTQQAQNVLLKITEDTPKDVYFIFCTNNDSKILPALRRRACIIQTHGIDNEGIHKLLLLAKNEAEYKKDISELEESLINFEINSPGLILQTAEKYFSGADITSCLFNTTSTTVDTKKLCEYVLKGKWKEVQEILKTVKKEDIVIIKIYILNYLKSCLLKTESLNTSISIAKAIKIINEECYDLPLFCANLRLACNEITEK